MGVLKLINKIAGQGDKIAGQGLAPLVKLYQLTLSPDHGLIRGWYPLGCCRFTPTCSEYMRQALLKYGLAKGIWLGFKRILRCNPTSQGGYDPVE